MLITQKPPVFKATFDKKESYLFFVFLLVVFFLATFLAGFLLAGFLFAVFFFAGMFIFFLKSLLEPTRPFSPKANLGLVAPWQYQRHKRLFYLLYH